MRSVFISYVTEEFEHKQSLFAGLRSQLKNSLLRADCNVKVQEDFRQTDEDTVLKIANYIKECGAVIHLLGEKHGSIAHLRAVAEFLDSFPDFLAKHPELRENL